MGNVASDYRIEGGGSVYLVVPLNDAARKNLEENVGDEALWYAGGLAVEHRYIEDLVATLTDEGWLVA